jgi:hypothetical protein
MSTYLMMTKLGPADAIAVTEKLKAVLKRLVAEHGEQAVNPEVIAAAKTLFKDGEPLRGLVPSTYRDRRDLDRATDVCITAIASVSELKLSAYDQKHVELTERQEQERKAAQLVLDTLYGEGTSFLRDRWSAQFGTTEGYMQKAGTKAVTKAIDALGLTGLMGLARELHELYGQRMGFTTSETASEASPLMRWHESLEAYIGTVIGKHGRNRSLRDELTAPYEEIAATVRAMTAAKVGSRSTGEAKGDAAEAPAPTPVAGDEPPPTREDR